MYITFDMASRIHGAYHNLLYSVQPVEGCLDNIMQIPNNQ